ncbi:MAG: hypothetical protein CBC13_09605 [Planctomycetia bacterium TMED53]|nr:MAG: hypothetical protein CBC13_09605 [Planctomycetia bacterium TMED53]
MLKFSEILWNSGDAVDDGTPDSVYSPLPIVSSGVQFAPRITHESGQNLHAVWGFSGVSVRPLEFQRGGFGLLARLFLMQLDDGLDGLKVLGCVRGDERRTPSPD